MKSYTVVSFSDAFEYLPEEIQNSSRKKFMISKENPLHHSLRFKCVNASHNIWSVRITMDYRALGVVDKNDIVWYWIGSHKEYEKLIKK